MKDHPINEILKTSLENINLITDVNKIIGEPIVLPNNAIAIPISKVFCAYGVGGTQFNNKNIKNTKLEISNELFPFGGASSGGLTITPTALIIIKENDIKILNIEKENELLPRIIDSIKDIIKK